MVQKLKSKQIKSNLNESDEDLMSRSNSKKLKHSGYVEIWRPLTPISCIVGEDEERTQTTKKEKLESTFLSPSSSVNSVKLRTRARRRLDSSSDDQNIKNKRLKTSAKNSKILLKDEDSCSSQNLSDSSDCIENSKRKRTRSNKKEKQTNTKLTSLNLNSQSNSQLKLINQFETVKESNQNSDDCKENFSETHRNRLPIWDRFYFSANNQLR